MDVGQHSSTVKKNEAYAYLSIDGFSCPVAELTRRIGLSPTEAWQAGDIVPPFPFPKNSGGWRIKSRISKLEEVERHVIDVLDQIAGREAVFRDIGREYCIRMQCVGYYNEYNPGFSLKPDIVRRLADFGMMVDLDAYCLYGDNQETGVDHDASVT
jgi:hypothetical protein